MKKILSVLAVVTSCLVFFNSCANFDNSGTSLTLSFKGSDFAGKAERNILSDSHDEAWYFVVNIEGDYKETKMVQFNEDEVAYTITFNRVPVGANVFVQANVYRPNDIGHMHYYSGRSENIKISSGDNFLNLSLNSKKNPSYPGNSQIHAENNDISYENLNCIWASLDFKFDSSIGKYQIYSGYGTQTVISEGLCSRVGDTFYITECVFNEVIVNPEYDNGGYDYNTTNNYTIITEPKERVIDIERSGDPNMPSSFTFYSQNGLVINFSSMYL